MKVDIRTVQAEATIAKVVQVAQKLVFPVRLLLPSDVPAEFDQKRQASR